MRPPCYGRFEEMCKKSKCMSARHCFLLTQAKKRRKRNEQTNSRSL